MKTHQGDHMKEHRHQRYGFKSFLIMLVKLFISLILFGSLEIDSVGAFHPTAISFHSYETKKGKSPHAALLHSLVRKKSPLYPQSEYPRKLKQSFMALEGHSRNYEDILRIAEKAALEAGEIMKQTSGKISVSKTKANASDLVTESDIQCQKVIKDIVKEAFPNDIFLGEEDVETGTVESSNSLENALKAMKETDELLWVVDPIDGTTNFQAGKSFF